jgi:hypothetical protein
MEEQRNTYTAYLIKQFPPSIYRQNLNTNRIEHVLPFHDLLASDLVQLTISIATDTSILQARIVV